MRAWQIAKVLILTQMCVGLVNGLFLTYDMGEASSPIYFETINDSETQFKIGDIEDLTSTSEDQEFVGMNTFDLGVGMVMSGGMLVWNVITSMVTIFPVLVNVFHCPTILAVIIQAGIYMEVLYGVAQWRSGRSGHAIEA